MGGTKKNVHHRFVQECQGDAQTTVSPVLCENACAALVEQTESIFPFLTREEVEELCPYLEARSWEAGETVIAAGGRGEFMGFLVEGKLAVKKETSFPGKFIVLAVLNGATIVGENALVQKKAHSTTVVAMEESHLLLLKVDAMEQLLQDNPLLGIKLLKRILYIVSLRLENAGERLAKLM